MQSSIIVEHDGGELITVRIGDLSNETSQQWQQIKTQYYEATQQQGASLAILFDLRDVLHPSLQDLSHLHGFLAQAPLPGDYVLGVVVLPVALGLVERILHQLPRQTRPYTHAFLSEGAARQWLEAHLAQAALV